MPGYEAMTGAVEYRMDEIQAQAEDYAKEVTRLRTQLDRSIEESKKIQTCPSEADVMRSWFDGSCTVAFCSSCASLLECH